MNAMSFNSAMPTFRKQQFAFLRLDVLTLEYYSINPDCSTSVDVGDSVSNSGRATGSQRSGNISCDDCIHVKLSFKI